MKLILITLVALVVGMMVACSSEPAAPAATAAPVAPPPPAYSDAEVIGAVKAHLMAPGMDSVCTMVARDITGTKINVTVRQDPSNPDKYLVMFGSGGSWTFIGSLGKVISTSTGQIGFRGC